VIVQETPSTTIDDFSIAAQRAIAHREDRAA
jgi:hypothetical protein